MKRSSTPFCVQHLFEARNEGRHVTLHRLPEDIQVDVEIGMNEAMAHADNILPGNLWDLSPRFSEV